LKVGILKTGRPPRAEIPNFGTYPDMFQRLLGLDAYDWRVFAADEGELPGSPTACDAYLITGGANGAYDPDPWIGATMDFLRAARGQAALVGVCLGHQLMAQAFGGRVIKSPKGWGIGLHDYAVRGPEPWMAPGPLITAPASHQDQVVALPPGARVLAGSDFTPNGMLAYDDQPAISIQLHPEFDPAYAKALIDGRRGRLFAEEAATRAIDSLDGPNDTQRIGDWIGQFLREHAGAR
jgi:GMP synthase-like glutamine amidotransferase